MKYFKDRKRDPFEAENEDEEEIAKELNRIGDLDAQARARGEKPADEWTRRDFYSLLNNHKELRILDVSELRALFLIPVDIGEKGIYYKRGSVWDVRRRRASGEKPLYKLADAPIDVYFEVNAPEQAEVLSRAKENKKLDAIWEKI